MTQTQLYAALHDGYIDSNGLVKPHKNDTTSDNGVLWTSDAQVLTSSDFQEDAIQDCYLVPGLLARKPRGINSQQEQFDDLLGRALRCIQSGNTKEPFEILWYGVRHLGVYNTDKQLQSKDFLFRFVMVFVLLFIAAFPFSKGVFKPLLTFYTNSFNPISIDDTSGLLLEWRYCMAHELLYGPGAETRWYNTFQKATGKKLSDIFAIYFEKEHPFTLFVEANLD